MTHLKLMGHGYPPLLSHQIHGVWGSHGVWSSHPSPCPSFTFLRNRICGGNCSSPLAFQLLLHPWHHASLHVHSGGGGGFCLQKLHSLRFSRGCGRCLGGGRIVCKSAQLPSASSATAVMREDRIDKLVDRVETTSVVQDWEEEKEMRMVMKELVDHIVPEALAWASLNGLVVGDKSIKGSGTNVGLGMVHAPLSLFPTSFPQNAFMQAVQLATDFNILIDRVSQDTQFLQEALASTQKVDSFTARLLDIHSQMLEEGLKQEIQLGLHRSDYMLDMATGSLLQVEINTISSSFAGLGSLISKLHRYLIERYGDAFGLKVENLPENNAMDAFAEALALAWKEFGDTSAVVLMVVHKEEGNMYDQYWLALRLWELYGVRVIRRTLAEVAAEAKLRDRQLFIGEQAVSVVYYRSGYAPADYPSEAVSPTHLTPHGSLSQMDTDAALPLFVSEGGMEGQEWMARLLLERSSAVKCPSISYHLAGAKKIQQELAKPGVLERFMPDREVARKVRKSFAGLWSLEGEGSAQVIEEAISNPQAFVLKPQREGGGNNIYGADVSTTLRELQKDEEQQGLLAAYILMQRMFPTISSSYLLRNGIWSLEDTVSELGIFGTYLRNGHNVVLNKEAGHLLRTKVSNSDEGGVAAGFAVLDSPYLT